jgi:hypothetical protein
VVDKGEEFNIFTHRKERRMVIDGWLFQFLIHDKVVLYNTEVDDVDWDEIKRNSYFYRLVGPDYKYGEYSFSKSIDGTKIIVDKKLSFYIEKRGGLTRINEVSYLLKKGMSLEYSIGFFNLVG